jgi:hypothetical protein
MDWTIVLSALTLIAILTGPIIALYIQRKLDEEQAAKNRRVNIFRTLMAHRATRLTTAFVEALNGIEVEFYGHDGSNRKIIEAWREYCEHLYNTNADDPAKNAAWNERGSELLNVLLVEMGESLGYHFEKGTLRRMVYQPRGWNDNETETLALRKATMEVFSGIKPLRMKIDGPVEISERP